MASFIIELLVGVFIGMTVMSMCVISKQSDNKRIIDTHADSTEDSIPMGKD